MRITLFTATLLLLSGCMQYTTNPATPPPLIVPEKKVEEISVKFPLIALDDQGKSGDAVGCGDSLIFVGRLVPAAEEGEIYAAYKELLSLKDENYGGSGLYNSLKNSDLSIESIGVKNDKATVKLKGTYSLGGVCDNPRFQAQLEQTALQFDSVEEVHVTINDVPLEQIVSEK